jgi:UDP-N-acetylmuramoylalanine--D-glutamate ligase
VAGAEGYCSFLDYYGHAGAVWAGDIEVAVGDKGVILAVSQDMIASSDYRVVVGLGATGVSCARYLTQAGHAFSMVDTRSAPPGLAQFRQEFPDVPVFVGYIPTNVLEQASELIVSPGVSLAEPAIAKAREAGVDIVGDIDLFARTATAPIIGITGSNAKSTVTALVGQMAADAGIDVGVGGNIGVPALDLLQGNHQLYVLELSSFQLERAGKLNLAVATVLNVSADHLDRHGSLPVYHQAKHRIFFGCKKAVVNKDDSLTTPLVADDVELVSWRCGEPELAGFGLRLQEGEEFLSFGFELLLPVAELVLPGRHNIANALAALAIGYSAGFPMASMLSTLTQFQGLPHRCQLVAEVNGVSYIDDSKGTNIGATEAALNGLAQGRNIILIAGGQAKGADFSLLAPAVSAHCKRVIVIGEAQAQIQASLSASVPVELSATLDDAVRSAAAQAQAGDCVLLSPACASFDMFTGYEHRGQVFSAAVRALAGAQQ